MEILKGTRKMENISPNKFIHNEVSAKKIKLNENEELEWFEDNELMFGSESDFIKTVELAKENVQLNHQNISKTIEPNRWYRFYVKYIETDLKTQDLVVILSEETKSQQIRCRLQGLWSQSKFDINHIVSVFPIWSSRWDCYVVNDKEGFFIINPDQLISGTTVVGSLFCQRKGILQEKFRGIDSGNKIMIIGILVHQLLQIAIKKTIISTKKIEDILKEVLSSADTIYMLYSSKMNLQETEEEIKQFIPNILNFIRTYVNDKEGFQTLKGETVEIAGIHDIEENLWTPKLGLKGKIDVSLKVNIRRKNIQSQSKIIPLELKTGRPSFSFEHKGQLILYQLMLEEIGYKTDSGLLLYLRGGELKEVPATRNEQRDLILLRNDISYYFMKFLESNSNITLPEPIHHPTACAKCPYSIICSTFLQNDPTIKLSTTHPLNEINKTVNSFIKPNHMDYFLFWCAMISLEDEDINKNNRGPSDLWNKTPEERMEHHKALINLKLVDVTEVKYEAFNHKFIFNEDYKSTINSNYSIFSIGEYVVISTSKRIALATGNVNEIDQNYIAISIERNMLDNYRQENFIIDKYESKSGNVFNFSNLGLLLDQTDHASFLRDIIIEKKSPNFAKKLPSILVREGKEIFEKLNKSQQVAVLKAIGTDSYMLIKGLPGTGKTQTLASIVRLLHLLKKTVIITSHTHSAVDNILLRLKQYNLPFLRLGSQSRIHPDLKEYGEFNQIQNCKTPEEINQVYMSYSIIGITCLGSAHAIFANQTAFDFCIVDEATQVYQPTVIRPLLFAKKFILVGDPDQLPPLIRSKKARETGADESLFQRLDSPEATVTLTYQYRMNRVITKLANDLTYKNQLQCANDNVKNAFLQLNNSILLEEYSKQKWLTKAVEKHVDMSVMFLDTLNCKEMSLNMAKLISKNSIISDIQNDKEKCNNYCEAALAFILIRALSRAGCKSENIGVIAPYRDQVDLLKVFKVIYQNKYKEEINLENLEINTVDQYQGRDKDIIIYTCTKTGMLNKEKIEKPLQSNEILEDRRRLTVAITRSKVKLIVIGDQNSLLRYSPFNDLIAKIPSRCKIVLEDGRLGFSWAQILDSISVL